MQTKLISISLVLLLTLCSVNSANAELLDSYKISKIPAPDISNKISPPIENSYQQHKDIILDLQENFGASENKLYKHDQQNSIQQYRSKTEITLTEKLFTDNISNTDNVVFVKKNNSDMQTTLDRILSKERIRSNGKSISVIADPDNELSSNIKLLNLESYKTTSTISSNFHYGNNQYVSQQILSIAYV